MSVWKSPVLYFGILLVLLVAFGLIAPFFVNWNAWKPELETYGRRLTGRQVEIGGNVDVRLFPWPRLTAHNVTIANAKEFGDAPLLAADSMTTRFSLAGLFSATLQVEEIEFDAPQINLIRSKSGTMNWHLAPDAALGGLLARVKLDRILVRNGGLWFEDKLRDQSHSLTSISASISGQALEGPWRLVGKGQWRDTALRLSVSTGIYDPAQGLRLALTATPDDIELPVFGIEGQWTGQRMAGSLHLTGQQAGDGKGSIQDKLRPLTLHAAYEWEAQSMSFSNIRIAPSDRQDSGTLIEGDAHISFTPETKARINLTAPRINLDSILGAGSMARWRRGGVLAVANSIFAELPPKASAAFSLDVNVLTANNQTLSDVRLAGVAERQAIRIHNASASLPGRSRAKFDGVIFPAAGAAELGGQLAFESGDLRSFVNWLVPRHSDWVKQNWVGERGHLKLQGEIIWSEQRLALQQATYELDGQAGEANLRMTFGELPQLLLSLDTKVLDLDSYLAPRDGLTLNWTPPQVIGLLPTALDLGQAMEHRLLLNADALTVNGVKLSGADIDYSASLSGLEIKAFNLTSADGTVIKTDGLVINGAEGPVGEIELDMAAPDMSGLLNMARMNAGPLAKSLARLFAATEAKLTLSITPRNGAPIAMVEGEARSGALTISTKGEFSNLAAPGGPSYKGSISLAASELGQALEPQLGSHLRTGPVSAAVSVDGNPESGYAADLSLQVLNSGLSYKGKIKPGALLWGLDGVAAVEASSLMTWRDALGLPLLMDRDVPLSWRGTVTQKEGKLWLVPDEESGTSHAVTATFAPSGEYSADIETGPLELQQVLAFTFLPWNGANVNWSTGFSSPEETMGAGEIFLRPTALRSGRQSVRESIIGVAASKEARRLTIKSPGKELDFDLSVSPRGDSFEVAGKGRMAVDLATMTAMGTALPAVSGQIIFEGEFSGTGRSPIAALQSLQGKGRYWLSDATLNYISVNGFGAGLETVANADALSVFLEKTSGPPGTVLPPQTGYVTIANGLATTSPIALKTPDERLVVEPSLDLSSGELTIKAMLQSMRRNDLPPVTYSYIGKPGSLNLRRGTAALAAKLGFELMSREMARFEELQKQEQEVLKREEQQRRDDQQRYEAYQAQRAELRQRLRELRFHQAERIYLKQARAAALEKALKEGDNINRIELARRQREVVLRRRLSQPLAQP